MSSHAPVGDELPWAWRAVEFGVVAFDVADAIENRAFVKAKSLVEASRPDWSTRSQMVSHCIFCALGDDSGLVTRRADQKLDVPVSNGEREDFDV